MKNINRLKVAIIGCGAVTQELHTPALLELEKRKLVSVEVLHDPNKPEVEKASRYFPAAKKCDSMGEVIGAGCDAVLICSPARFHAEQTVRCLKAGLHVLCEKPMAISVPEAQKMIDCAKENGKLLAIGQVRRFFPATQTIKQIIDGGVLGKMKSFHAREGGSFGWPAKSASFFDPKIGGGGVLIDNGIHALDLLLWWMGEPKTFTYQDDAMGGIEINCRVNMDYESFRGTLQVTWDYEIPNAYYFEFEKGWIYWQPYNADQIDIGFKGVGQSLHGMLSPNMEQGIPKPGHSGRPLSYYHNFLPEWMNFIMAAQNRESLRVPGEEAIKSLAFVEKCYAHRSFMEPPWFTDKEKASAQKRVVGSRQ